LYKQQQSGNGIVSKSMRSDGFVNREAANSAFEKLGKTGASKNDAEVKVEKALIELNEIRNDIIFQKKEEAANKNQTTKDSYALQQ
jgi:hypothetical protein